MPELEILPAPTLPPLPDGKWRAEQRAFEQILPALLPVYHGQYVAVHEGKVVESGQDKLDVAGKAYARFGYVPIYVGLVSDSPTPTIRIPSSRVVSSELRR